MFLVLVAPPGEPVLPAQHRPGSDHQAEGDPPGRVQSVHEGGQSHAHPGSSAGHRVRPAALQTRRTRLLRDIRLHYAHPDALPGEPGSPLIYHQMKLN